MSSLSVSRSRDKAIKSVVTKLVDDLSPISQQTTLPMPTPMPQKRVQYDSLPIQPAKKTMYKSEGDLVKSQPILHIGLPSDIKGYGYTAVGNPLAVKPRTLKHQFTFDLSCATGVRAWCASQVRHSNSAYLDTDNACLSPALAQTDRVIDNVTLKSAMRNPHAIANKTMFMSTSLFDLELASWNANPLKLIYEPSTNAAVTNTVTATSLGVYSDYMPTSDHNKFTPFPSATYGSSTTAQIQRPPFMVNLGPGSVSYTFLNRLATSSEVEIVVFQIRDDSTSVTLAATSWTDAVTTYSGTSYVRNLGGPVITTSATGSGGEVTTSSSVLTDPTVKFLPFYNKWMTTKSPCIEKSRNKFMLVGGGVKTVKLHLPAKVYNSQVNSSATGDPFAAVPTQPSHLNPLSYLVFIAINGVLMPVFAAPTTNNTNGVQATDFVCGSIVDRQTGPASVVVTGEYIEHPKPCLSTIPVRMFNNYPMLQDTSVTPLPGTGQPVNDLTLYANAAYLVSGYVNDMPQAVASGQVVSFGKADTHEQEPMEGH